ncbi:MAG: NADP-dependent oxidoreductase [Polyangiales bacterium]
MMNKQVRLASRPEGLPNDRNWSFGEGPVPEPGDGEVLVKISHISLDPAMRAWMNEGATYIDDVKVGDVMRANTVGEVIESKSEKLRVGDTVQGVLGVQQYALAKPKELLKIDARLAPIQSYLGVLGWPGMTAYFGLRDIGKAKEGETVVISGAAGAVGSVAGQIAKIKGCRVIGIAGGPDKCRYLIDELGFDGAIDYKNENIRNRLSELCPKRVDVFFDNVGGEILDAVLSKIAMRARIVISGAISQYNNPRFRGPNNYMALLTYRARMEGFVVFDYVKECGEAAAEIAQWMAEGKLKAKDHIIEGIENFPSAFLRLFTGEKLGKLILKV